MLNPETDSLHLSVILATCLGTSLAFMLPVGTPPNAIVYGTGRLKMKTMVRVGLTLNLTSIITIFIYFRFFYERG
jgi:sodium-dependent dicarboxylate transporter 2/3/5